jgi:hypothetical protein
VLSLSDLDHDDTDTCAGLLETVLFAQIRFHDTVSRGRKYVCYQQLHMLMWYTGLLNRFGKDFEGKETHIFV